MRQWLYSTLCLLFTLVACAQPTPDWQGWLAEYEVDADAHWVSADTLLMPKPAPGTEIFLVARDRDGERSVPLTPGVLSVDIAAKVPHLKELSVWNVDLSREEMRALTKVALYILEHRNGDVLDVSQVQTGWLLDDLYTSGSNDADEATDLGAVALESGTAFALWAPTASDVSVEFYNQDGDLIDTLPMTEDNVSGIWRAATAERGVGAYYRFRVHVCHPSTAKVEVLGVTDPYSLSLSVDSRFSQVIDLHAADVKPAGWDQQTVATVPNPEAQIIYETHVGDFSGTDESISDLSLRGTYRAFTLKKSDGGKHLQRLAEAGLTTIHLLPVYDLGSIPEADGSFLSMRSSVRQACDLVPEAPVCGVEDPGRSLAEVLASYRPQSPDAQALIEAIDELDDYNWGYDPYHYTVPEGSYAVDPDGFSRIVEFREMILALHEMGFRVVMDVVYNHTFQSGLSEKSVLDKIVPGYYHRRHPVTGAIEQSTCCENTATERVMMDKLMRDSLVVWARDYKIDGFRFDLMGHQPKDAMLRAREAVRVVDPDTYFYGEGWNFGEVANDARFEQATQLNLSGTEIGTFTDRLRDAVRGGSSFVDGDDLRRGQGLGNGLVTQPNELQDETALDIYTLYADQVRLGLAGNLASYQVPDRNGGWKSGKDISYGDQPAGYAEDPADTITYVSKHDNQTLWDNNSYRIASHATADERARMQVSSLSFVLYAQGIPFIHMGSELLRSKSFLRDSYNYSHWFNDVDFSLMSNNADAGLPPAVKDQANWEIIARLREASEGRDRVGAPQINATMGAVLDMLSVRSRSPLFSLETAEQINKRVSFLYGGDKARPGLIVMRIDDGAQVEALDDLDAHHSEILVVFNHGPDTQLIEDEAFVGLVLHPTLASGADPIVRASSVEGAQLSVPGWTTAVFVRPQEIE